jgi:hypothetical protein
LKYKPSKGYEHGFWQRKQAEIENKGLRVQAKITGKCRKLMAFSINIK